MGGANDLHMSDEYFVDSTDVSTQQFDWGTLKWMATPDHNGSERFSAGVVQLELLCRDVRAIDEVLVRHVRVVRAAHP